MNNIEDMRRRSAGTPAPAPTQGGIIGGGVRRIATATSSSSFVLCLLLLVVLLAMSPATTDAAMTDPATGISFAPKLSSGLEVFGVGVRKKGPIKVYSVAMYGATSLKDKLAGLSKSDPQAVSVLRKGAASASASDTADESDAPGGSAVFDLQMSFKVSGEKMASAIAESVAPRFGGAKEQVDALKAMIASGVGDQGATKGTTFRFECHHSGMDVHVNGKSAGSIPSPDLAKAFCDVYLDDKCVSPTLKTSILENCCAP